MSQPIPEPAPEPGPHLPEPAPETPPAPAAPAVAAPPGGEVITLPVSGFQVAVRSAKSLRNRDRQRLLLSMNDDPNQSKVAAGLQMVDLIVGLLVVAWNVRALDEAGQPVGEVLPIPSLAPESLGELMIEDANRVNEVAEAARVVIFPDFSPSPDPESPTPPAAG